MIERWLQIYDFPRYSVSNLGRVRNDDTGRIMSMIKNAGGVLVVYLMGEDGQCARGVARLVANHFLPRSTDLHNTPLHLDGDKTNNAAYNLIWRPRWYANEYTRQFLNRLDALIHHPIVEVSTGLEFRDSWEAAKYFGLLEREVAKSCRVYQQKGVTAYASPSLYHFRVKTR